MQPVQMCEAGPEVRRYRKAIWISMGGYMVMLLLAITFIKEFPGSSWRYPVMLVPVIPAIFGLVGIMRAVRAMDEMQRRVHLEGVAFAFVVTVLITLSWGLLASAVGNRESNRDETIQMKNRLRDERAKREWSQAELAERLSVSRQTVNAIETGKYDPSLPLAFRLAEVFGAKIEELFQPE